MKKYFKGGKYYFLKTGINLSETKWEGIWPTDSILSEYAEIINIRPRLPGGRYYANIRFEFSDGFAYTITSPKFQKSAGGMRVMLDMDAINTRWVPYYINIAREKHAEACDIFRNEMLHLK